MSSTRVTQGRGWYRGEEGKADGEALPLVERLVEQPRLGAALSDEVARIAQELRLDELAADVGRRPDELAQEHRRAEVIGPLLLHQDRRPAAVLAPPKVVLLVPAQGRALDEVAHDGDVARHNPLDGEEQVCVGSVSEASVIY